MSHSSSLDDIVPVHDSPLCIKLFTRIDEQFNLASELSEKVCFEAVLLAARALVLSLFIVLWCCWSVRLWLWAWFSSWTRTFCQSRGLWCRFPDFTYRKTRFRSYFAGSCRADQNQSPIVWNKTRHQRKPRASIVGAGLHHTVGSVGNQRNVDTFTTNALRTDRMLPRQSRHILKCGLYMKSIVHCNAMLSRRRSIDDMKMEAPSPDWSKLSVLSEGGDSAVVLGTHWLDKGDIVLAYIVLVSPWCTV